MAQRSNLDYEGNLASVSLAGVHPVFQTTVAVGAASTGSHSVSTQRPNTKRVVVFHSSGVDTDIRINFNATATATHMPVISNMYFVMECRAGESVNFYNTSGGSITVNIMEIE